MNEQSKTQAALLAVLFASAITAAPWAHAQSGDAANIAAATEFAQAEFKAYLANALTETSKRLHRLSPDDSYENASLGAPFQLNELVPDSVAECIGKTCMSADVVSVPRETYLFPLSFDGEIKLILSVYEDPSDGQFKLGYLGNRTLAVELEQIFQVWRPDAIKLFVNHQSHGYYFSVPSTTAPNLTAIDRGGMARANYGTLTPLDNAIPALNAKIIQGLKGWE